MQKGLQQDRRRKPAVKIAPRLKLELEGIVAKRAESIYTAGRFRLWLKIKTRAGIERERGRLASLRR